MITVRWRISDASEDKDNGNRDHDTEMLPLYAVANEQTPELGNAEYERDIH
jgi:hypothetical protein